VGGWLFGELGNGGGGLQQIINIFLETSAQSQLIDTLVG